MKAGLGSMLGDAVARDINGQAVRVFKSKAVQEACRAVTALFAADPAATADDQKSLIATAASAHIYYAAQVAVLEKRSLPGFVWTLAPPVRWGRLAVPDSRIGVDNPDNANRMAVIDPSQSYRIRSRFSGQAPCDFTISALPAAPGDGILARTNAVIALGDIDIAEDGSFEVLLGPEPTNGRRNHLDITGSSVLFVRSTMGDWIGQTPGHLTIVPAREMAAADGYSAGAEQRAAKLAYEVAKKFLEAQRHDIYERRPRNQFSPVPEPSGPQGGLPTQAAVNGTYRLKAEEALLIDVDVMSAAYLGSQISDLWMLSYPYWDRVSSLNQSQAARNADGRFRIVVSAADPGVYNWLDSGGRGAGTLTLRWQGIPVSTRFDENSCRISVVPVEKLRSILPADTRYVSPQERAKQCAERSCAYRARLA